MFVFLDAGSWILVPGYWFLDAGFWAPVPTLLATSSCHVVLSRRSLESEDGSLESEDGSLESVDGSLESEVGSPIGRRRVTSDL